jgi:hypothetical protein
VSEKLFSKSLDVILPKGPLTFDYEEYLKKMAQQPTPDYKKFPCIIPNWDNTPRSKRAGWVLKNTTPQQFGKLLEQSIQSVQKYPEEERIVFIKSWNEWAEGNYIEPDEKNGRGYLEVCKQKLVS